MNKIKRRDIDEIAIDRLLLLYLIKEANRYVALGRTRLQKFAFLSEYKMLSNKIKGLNLKFFRWNIGPMSEEVYQDCEVLCRVGLINGTEWPIALTEFGKRFLTSFLDVIRKKRNNERILAIISEIARHYRCMDIDKLKKSVYNLTVKPVGREEELKIKDIPLGTDIIAKIEDKEAKIFFELNAEDIEDLEVSLNPSFIKRVQNTLRDYRNGKLKVGDWEGIFSGV